jgi:hypothetical protein
VIGLGFGYHQLAHNGRHPATRKSTASLVYNFGRTETGSIMMNWFVSSDRWLA